MKKKLNFNKWLVEVEGIDPEYFDNNYDGGYYDDVMARYDDYLEDNEEE